MHVCMYCQTPGPDLDISGLMCAKRGIQSMQAIRVSCNESRLRLARISDSSGS